MGKWEEIVQLHGEITSTFDNPPNNFPLLPLNPFVNQLKADATHFYQIQVMKSSSQLFHLNHHFVIPLSTVKHNENVTTYEIRNMNIVFFFPIAPN